MNTQQTRWMMDFGQVAPPKEWSEKVKVEVVKEKTIITKVKKLDHKQMITKLRRGIIALLRRGDMQSRDEIYEILKERNFLPIIAEYKQMSVIRFYRHYAQARISIGFKRHRETKIDFIKAHYKIRTVQSMADHLDCKIIYVQQTISKIRRGLIK